jgi:hypothetical protein
MVDAGAQLKTCVRVVLAKPEYASLMPHTPDPWSDQPTMSQMTNESLPAAGDAKLLAARFDDATSCRARFLNTISTVRPDLVPIYIDLYSKNAANAAMLVERKITRVEAVRRGQALSSEGRQKINLADREWAADLNAAHQAEMANRQAAANAMMQWSAQQQMINSMNRPRQTNCYGFGNSVNCTSY